MISHKKSSKTTYSLIMPVPDLVHFVFYCPIISMHETWNLWVLNLNVCLWYLFYTFSSPILCFYLSNCSDCHRKVLIQPCIFLWLVGKYLILIVHVSHHDMKYKDKFHMKGIVGKLNLCCFSQNMFFYILFGLNFTLIFGALSLEKR